MASLPIDKNAAREALIELLRAINSDEGPNGLRQVTEDLYEEMRDRNAGNPYEWEVDCYRFVKAIGYLADEIFNYASYADLMRGDD